GQPGEDAHALVWFVGGGDGAAEKDALRLLDRATDAAFRCGQRGSGEDVVVAQTRQLTGEATVGSNVAVAGEATADGLGAVVVDRERLRLFIFEVGQRRGAPRTVAWGPDRAACFGTIRHPCPHRDRIATAPPRRTTGEC